MKSYREHVADQFKAEAAAKVGVMDESLAGRYLRAASELEIKGAQDFWSRLQSAAGDEQRLAMIVQDRRGSALDLLLAQVASSGAYYVGRYVAARVPSSIASLPGYAGFLAALLAKLPYAARATIQTAANSYNMGVSAELEKGG